MLTFAVCLRLFVLAAGTSLHCTSPCGTAATWRARCSRTSSWKQQQRSVEPGRGPEPTRPVLSSLLTRTALFVTLLCVLRRLETWCVPPPVPWCPPGTAVHVSGCNTDLKIAPIAPSPPIFCFTLEPPPDTTPPNPPRPEASDHAARPADAGGASGEGSGFCSSDFTLPQAAHEQHTLCHQPAPCLCCAHLEVSGQVLPGHPVGSSAPATAQPHSPPPPRMPAACRSSRQRRGTS